MTRNPLRTLRRRSLRDKVGDWFAQILGLDQLDGPNQVVTDEEGFSWVDDFDSSNVEAIGWNLDSSTLRIRFGVDKPSETYEYPRFPLGVMEDFMNATSKGTFVWEVIRNSGADDVYPFRKL